MNHAPSLRSVLLLVTSLAMTAASSVRADVYGYTDHEGVLHITDIPRDARYQLVLREPKPAPAPDPAPGAVPTAPIASGSLPLALAALQPLIQAAASKYRVDAALVQAVIQVESNFNSRAVSSMGAQGLMQLMPATARRYGVTDVFDPAQNVHAGVRYLAELLTLFKSDLRLALAAYNAGENAVIKYGNQIPPFRETQHYVPKVLTIYRRFQAGKTQI